MLVFVQSFVLAFGALLPLLNPLGSALIFLGIVGHVPQDEFHQLARRVGISTALFLLTIELAGATILAFFGISLPVVQFAGGLVVAVMGFQLLNQKNSGDDPTSSPDTGR